MVVYKGSSVSDGRSAAQRIVDSIDGNARTTAALSRSRQIARSSVQIGGEPVLVPVALETGVEGAAVADAARAAIEELETVTLPALQVELDELSNVGLPGLREDLDALTDVTIPALQDDLAANTDALGDLNTVVLPDMLDAIAVAQAAADGAIRTFYQADAPWPDGSSQPGDVLGDMWFRTTDDTAHRWNGTSWSIIRDDGIASALAAANAAQSDADAAASAASAAAGVAAGKGKVLIQPAAPAAADRLPQNLWIDTTGGANVPKRWVSGTTWAAVTDKVATDAAAAAVVAKSAADAAKARADAAYDVGAAAQDAADLAQAAADDAAAAAAAAQGELDALTGTTLPALQSDLDAAEAAVVVAKSAADAAKARADLAVTNAATADGKAAAAATAASNAQTAANNAQGDANTIKNTTIPALNTSVTAAADAASAAKAAADALAARGDSLVINGSGELGSTAYWGTGVSLSPANTPTGYPNAFTTGTGYVAVAQTTGAAITVNANDTYRASLWVDGKQGMRHYLTMQCRDAFGNHIAPYFINRVGASLTTLAAPLVAGDTTATLTDGSGWYATGAGEYMASWPYVDPSGKTWNPEDGYTRNVRAIGAMTRTGNVISFALPWAGATLPAGTVVTENRSSGSYVYPAWGTVAEPDGIHVFDGTFGGGIFSGLVGDSKGTRFWPGTARITMGALLNHNTLVGTDTPVYFTGMRVTNDSARSAANAAQLTADGKNSVLTGTAIPATALGKRQGDIYWRLSGGIVIGQYVFSGTVWEARTLDSATIANLDAGKISAGTISADRIGARTIDAGKLVADSITAAEIKADAITASELAANAVTAVAIKAGEITAAKMAVGTITAASGIIGDAAIVTAKIGDLAVTDAKIGSLDAAKITTGYLAAARIEAGSLDASVIAADTITAVQIKADAITASELAANSVTAASVKAGEITAAKMAVGTITAASGILADAVITTAKIANLAVTDAQVGNLSAVKITAGFLAAARIQAGTIAATHLASDSVTAVKIKAGEVVAGKLAADSVLANNIKAGEVTAGKLSADSVVASNIAAGAIIAEKIGVGAITAEKLAVGAITAEKIASDAITGKTISGGTITGTSITGATITGTTTVRGGRLVIDGQPGTAASLVINDASGNPSIDLQKNFLTFVTKYDAAALNYSGVVFSAFEPTGQKPYLHIATQPDGSSSGQRYIRIGQGIDGAAVDLFAPEAKFDNAKVGGLDVTYQAKSDAYLNRAGGKSAPYAMAAGTLDATSAPNAGGNINYTINFPPGRFSQPPVVTVNDSASRFTTAVNTGVTTSSFTVSVGNWSGGGGGVGYTHTIAWQAVQMTAGSAAG